MWLVFYLPMLHTEIFLLHFFYFQNNGGALKKVSNALKEILLASTPHSFVMATSIVPMAVMKNLVVGAIVEISSRI